MTDIPDDTTGARATVGEGELAALMSVAEAVDNRPREWRWSGDYPQQVISQGNVILIAECYEGDMDRGSRHAEYIATFDPPTVLGLIAALKEARAIDTDTGSILRNHTKSLAANVRALSANLAAVTAERDRLAGVIARVEGLCDEADSRRGTAQFFGNVQTGTLRRVLDDALTTTSEGDNA